MVFSRLKMAVAKGFLGSASAFIIMSSAINVANAKATAESNHAFIGAQIGTSMLTQSRESNLEPSTYNYKDAHITASYGILGGYEVWFTNSLVGRFYMSFGGANLYVLNFGMGSDIIWNFINVGGGNLGIFGGLFFGGNYWLNGWYESSRFSNFMKGNAAPSTTFDIAFNLGVRWALNRHAIEVLGKIPFFGAEVRKTTYTDGDIISYYSNETFCVMARYMYRF